MFMKHYAPIRCEPSIEVIVNLGVQPSGGGGGGGGGGGWLVARLGVGGGVG